MSVETPCKKECLYSHTLGHCETCGRTLEDLSVWTTTTREDRKKRSDIAKRRIRKMNEL